MIDRDLAELYGVETRVLNQAVKRNSCKHTLFNQAQGLGKIIQLTLGL